jgi:hypothetical protein
LAGPCWGEQTHILANVLFVWEDFGLQAEVSTIGVVLPRLTLIFIVESGVFDQGKRVGPIPVQIQGHIFTWGKLDRF